MKIKDLHASRIRISLFLVLIFIVVFVLVISYQYISRALTDTVIGHKKSLVTLITVLVHERLDEFKDLGRSLALRPLLVEKVGQGDWDGAIHVLQDIPQNFSLVDRIFLADPQSIIRADFPHLGNAVGESRKQTDWYKGVSQTWQPYISVVFKRESVPRVNVIDVAIPIRSGIDGSPVIGILVLQVQANHFAQIVKDLKFNKGEGVYILDQKGQVVYSPLFSSGGRIVDFSSIPAVGEALQGRGGTKEVYNSIEHKWKFSALQRLDEFGWVVIVSQPLQTTFAQRDQILFEFVLFYSICFVVGVFLLLLILYFWAAQQKAYDDLKGIQAQLIQSDKMASVGQLAAGVAHEINNPVGFISSNIDVLQEYVKVYGDFLKMVEVLTNAIETGNMDKAKEVLGQMALYRANANLEYITKDMDKLFGHTRGGIERVQNIVKDMKIFSHEDHGEVSSVKIEEVIDSVLNIVHNEIKYKAQLKKNYGDTSLVHCGFNQMGQVFINLLINAVHAIENKGVIEIRTYQEGRYVCVDVRDTGIGIPEENIKKIFDPFFTTKPVGKGTGLGLSVSYEIVKKYGGEITVRSQVGIGTTFTVRLPMK